MVSLGHKSLMQYRLNEAVGRPFDSTVNVARMIGSGVLDRHPKLQVLVVHMGGELASVLGRLDFSWHLNYDGIPNPPAGKPYTNLRKPSEYCKTATQPGRTATIRRTRRRKTGSRRPYHYPRL
jgi:predicted TIM-barrel fold metal-dependent hydrolase